MNTDSVKPKLIKEEKIDCDKSKFDKYILHYNKMIRGSRSILYHCISKKR
jgi:hypothetical protein